jgi:hypothetical protein
MRETLRGDLKLPFPSPEINRASLLIRRFFDPYVTTLALSSGNIEICAY